MEDRTLTGKNGREDMASTYERAHPKSATFKKVDVGSANRRQSNLVPVPLHSIKEEQLESSQRQNKSQSERGNRPGTPEFSLAESDHLDLVEDDSDHDPGQE